MKQYLFCVMMTAIVFCYADRQQEDFLQAQHLANSKQYKEAIVLYDTLIKPGFLVFYNKGICYYQLHNYLEAYIAFKKAERFADKNNYRLVEKALDETAKMGGFEIQQSWKDTLYTSRYYVPLFVVQLFFILTLFFTIWFLLYRSFSWKSFMLFMFCIVQGFYVGFLWYMQTRQVAIVVVPAAVYAGPGKEYQAYTSFSVGSLVNVDKKEKSWYKIKASQKTGWVEETAVNMIEE